MTNYEQGFAAKCAQHNIDPEALIKWAAGPVDPLAAGQGFTAEGNKARVVPAEKTKKYNKEQPGMLAAIKAKADKATSRNQQLKETVQIAKDFKNPDAEAALSTSYWPSPTRGLYNDALKYTKQYDKLRKTKSKDKALNDMSWLGSKSIKKLINWGFINADNQDYNANNRSNVT